MLIIGHSEKNINERLNSLRYARVRRGKQNPVKAFFTYGYVPDISLNPWYHIPNGYDIKQIYPNGLIEKVNVVFPSWFRLVRREIFLYINLFFQYFSRINDQDNYLNVRIILLFHQQIQLLIQMIVYLHQLFMLLLKVQHQILEQ